MRNPRVGIGVIATHRFKGVGGGNAMGEIPNTNHLYSIGLIRRSRAIICVGGHRSVDPGRGTDVRLEVPSVLAIRTNFRDLSVWRTP